MRFSFDWLKKHLKTDKSVREIANILTFLGLEVEEVIDADAIFKGFVVASVSNVEKHPNADKLHTCLATLADGSERHIVCGAQNLKDGLKVILALPGAVIPSTGTTLKLSKIRGVPSEGMLCSLEELGLADESDGIIELPADTSLFAKVSELVGFGGGILDVSITPNRGDCFCIRGLARDLAGAGAGELLHLEYHKVDASKELAAKITVDSVRNSDIQHAIPYIAFRTITGIANKPSPAEIQKLLKSANVGSHSSVVDFANFIMLDNCRPFHIYDLNKIKNEIEIRFAQDGEKLVDLHGKLHKLSGETLVACNGSDLLCIIGIIGAEKCACDENTTDILIESAYIDPVYMATIGNKYNIVSDARTRFERGVDPSLCITALDELTHMIVFWCGGTASKIQEFGNLNLDAKKISISEKKLEQIAGFHIELEQAIQILCKLGLNLISSDNGNATFSIPMHRFDLSIEEDLIEEILRILGYEKIPFQPLEIKKKAKDKELNLYKSITSLKRFACACGLSEVSSFSFISKDSADIFASEFIPDSEKIVVIANPINSDLSVMRNSLYPNLLSETAKSLRFSNRASNLFEVGNVYSMPNEQQLVFSAVRAGLYGERIWIGHNRSVDVFDVKSDLFACLTHLGVDTTKLTYDTERIPSYYHPAKSASLLLGNNVIGYLGEMHPNVRDLFNLNVNVAAFEVYLDKILKPQKHTFVSMPEKVYQAVSRDFSFVFKSKDQYNIHAGDIVGTIRKVNALIKSVIVFDYYKIDESSIALGVSITIQSDNSTLTDADIKAVCQQVVTAIEDLGCDLR